MPHSLFRLTSRVYNTPHLITAQSFNVILDYLDQRNAAGRMDVFDGGDNDPFSEPDDDGDELPADFGVLVVDGSLTYQPVMTMCGEAGTSYQSLTEQVDEMAESGVKTIVMQVTSGGGEASHVFQCANDIRATCDENNIRLVGYIDTIGASAAYALSCVCDEIIANPSADVGSIGCVVALMDTSKAYEKAGLKRIFITSGESKVPFAEDGSFKQEFLDEIQASVDKLNVEFATHVSQYTGLSVDTIMGFEAKCFDADEALKLGLVNQVMTNKEFAAYVAQIHKET